MLNKQTNHFLIQTLKEIRDHKELKKKMTKYLQTKPGSLEEAVLISRGLNK